MEQSIEIKNRFHYSSKSKQVMIDVIVYAFIFMFLVTGIEKALDQTAFIKSLNQYTYIKDYANSIAILVPFSEIAVSILLFFPKTRKTGIYASLILMIIFTIALITIIYTTGLSNCGCSGYLAKLSAGQHIWFNGIFIALAITAILLTPKSFRPKRRNLFAIVATLSIIAIPFTVNTIYNKQANDILIEFYYETIFEEPLNYAEIEETFCGVHLEIDTEYKDFKAPILIHYPTKY